VRVLGYHGGATGTAFRRYFDALGQEFDLSTPLLRLEASRAAAAGALYEVATRTLVTAQRKRETGRGRRISQQQIERLARRQGLANADYSQALTALRALAGHNGHDLAAALRERRP
jgi:hypothetical protein